MKKSEIILDFTSLLDVTMIILFFFIINYNAQTNKLQEEAQSEMEQARSIEAQAQADMERLESDRAEFEKERDELREQAALEMERLNGANDRTARSIEAMALFEREQSIRLILIKSESGWALEIYSGEEILRTVEKGTDIPAAIKDTFENAGFTSDDVLLVQFLFDSDMPGSHGAKTSVDRALDRIRTDYPYLYCATVDTSSVGK